MSLCSGCPVSSFAPVTVPALTVLGADRSMNWRSVLGQCLPYRGVAAETFPLLSHLASDGVFTILPTQTQPCLRVFAVPVIPVLPGSGPVFGH